MKNAGILYIVSTPIGNLEDITLRALRVLKEVDLIACEDTRVSKKLLDHYDIRKPTISYFQHSKLSKIEYLISELKSGKNIALVTDAGTPGISDPGQALIQRIKEETITKKPFGFAQGEQDTNNKQYSTSNIQIIPIPGPSALTAAASVSGMIEKEFFFAGFLPKKKGRQTKFREFAKMDVPIVIYESANRLGKTLGDIRDYLGTNTEVFVAREITKMFEEYWGGKIDEVLADLSNHQIKGEIVLVVKRSGNLKFKI